MKALTDKIINALKSRRNKFLGSLKNAETIAETKGYTDGLSQAIEIIETLESSAEFEEIARIMMKHLANPQKYHPHYRVIIDSTNAELLEGKESTGQTMDYITD